MARLLVVHHTTSPVTAALLEAVREGASVEGLEDVEVVVRPALSAGAADLLAAHGVLLGTPVNIGYMSGALKHFFDTVYYPCLDATVGLPYGLWVHGGDNLAGAVRSVEQVATGLRWRQAAAHCLVTGAPGPEDLDACRELAGTVAAGLL